MKNIICIWYGAIVDIPAGWVLCDGNNSTPDLRNMFVVGAGDSYNPDDSGGAATHTHDGTTDGHFHDLEVSPHLAHGADQSDSTNIKDDTFTTDPGSTLPPYYALAYIMKS